MKYIFSPLLAYLIVCIIGGLVTGEAGGHHPIVWKLIILQFYAIPVLIISALISLSLYIYRKKSHN